MVSTHFPTLTLKIKWIHELDLIIERLDDCHEMIDGGNTAADDVPHVLAYLDLTWSERVEVKK